jgi:hypothetical protein
MLSEEVVPGLAVRGGWRTTPDAGGTAVDGDFIFILSSGENERRYYGTRR